MDHGLLTIDYLKTNPQSNPIFHIAAAIERRTIHQPEIEVLQAKTEFVIVVQFGCGEVIEINDLLQLQLTDAGYFIGDKAREVVLQVCLDVLGKGAETVIIEQ
jgi:hypothetical protein